MKKFNNIIITVLVMGLVVLVGCKGNDDPDPEKTQAQKQFEALSNITWVPTSVTRDGDDVTSEFSDFQLTFRGDLTDDKSNVDGTYETVNGGEIWPTSGAWEFGPEVLNTIIRSDQVTMNYTVTDTSLTLTFTYTTDGGSSSRTQVVDGEYVFELEASS